MNLTGKITLLLLVLNIISPASVSASIWDDAKEFAETHKKKIVIGAAIVVAAAAVTGAVVGGTIIHNRRQKQVEDGLRGVRDAAALGANSAAGSNSSTKPVQISEPAEIVVTHYDLNQQQKYLASVVEVINKRCPDLKLVLYPGADSQKVRGLLYCAQLTGRFADNYPTLAESLSKEFNKLPVELQRVTPKILFILSPSQAEKNGDEITRAVAHICPQLGSLFDRIFTSHMQGIPGWNVLTTQQYENSQLKAALDELAATLNNQS